MGLEEGSSLRVGCAELRTPAALVPTTSVSGPQPRGPAASAPSVSSQHGQLPIILRRSAAAGSLQCWASAMHHLVLLP